MFDITVSLEGLRMVQNMALAAMLEQVCENAFQLGGHTDETGVRSCDVRVACKTVSFFATI